VNAAPDAALVSAVEAVVHSAMPTDRTRAGTVALIGLPNAGKSSLLNCLLGEKLSIVTPHAQTTRERVVGIETRDGVQMVFLDTPGILQPAYLLHRSLAAIVQETIADADVVVLVLDGTRGPPALAPELYEVLQRKGNHLLPVVNKVDVAAETQRTSLSSWARESLGREPLALSARTGAGVEEMREEIAAMLPESPFLYPDEEISSQPVRFFVAELVRETVFERYAEEIPYSAAVRIQEFREAADPLLIRAEILVERPTQKAILIGKRGAAIRELGTAARIKIEAFLDRRVYLDLWVKVIPKWRKSPVELRRLGFPVPEEKD
jgi:GTP-binding protein Era